MRIGIMQPYCFPYLGYFQLIKVSDKFILLDDVNYINRGWINRNNLLSNQGPVLFTIPLSKASQNKKINEIPIFNFEQWKLKFLKTIELTYQKAPYFEKTRDSLTTILDFKGELISEFNAHCINQICRLLKITTTISNSSDVYENQNLNLNGVNRILDICKKEKADEYINAPGGRHLYSKADFEIQGIKLNFLSPQAFPYTQFNTFFTPNLSIIDVLMFNNEDNLDKLLNKYDINET